MSALFGKPDYKKTLSTYVNRGEYKKALKFAIKSGDKYYDNGEVNKSIGVYLFLLRLFRNKNVVDHSLYERLYEKLIPLLFESNQEEEALNYSLDLIDEKLVLNKDSEVLDILSALKEQFPESEAIVLKTVEVYLSKGDVQSALKELDKAISSIGPKPKFIELAGEILLKIHKYEDAYDYFNALLAVDPDNQLAKQRISELESAFALSKTPPLKNKEVKEETGAKTTENVKGTVVSTSSESLSKPSQEKQINAEATSNRNVLAKLKNGQHPENKKVDLAEQTMPDKVKVVDNKPNGAHSKGEISKDVNKLLANQEKSRIDNSTEKDKYKPLLAISKDSLYVKAIKSFLKDEKQGYEALISVAEKYETTNLIDAEYIYLKLFAFEPTNSKVAHKLLSLYDKIASVYDVNEVKAEKLFISLFAAKNSSGIEKLEFLKQIEKELPDELSVKIEILKNLSLLGKKEEALKYFNEIKDKVSSKDLNEVADITFSTVKNDVKSLEVIARVLYRKDIKTSTSFKYFYALGNILFNSGNKPDGLKWLLRANEVNKLSLDDYVKIAEYIKGLPLDTEKDVVAEALNGYVDIAGKDRKDYLFKLILSLKPHNVLYVKRYAEYLSANKRFKEEVSMLKVLAERLDINSAEFVNNKIHEVAQYLGIGDLKTFEKFFDFAQLKLGVLSVYEIMLQKMPSDEEVKIKHFIVSVEIEDEDNILHFFRENDPSHKYMSFVSNKISEYEQLRLKSMLDYHIHFVLGFLYYLVERFEESIASFQFVVRSHRFEPLMHLFLGMSFEKIALAEFATKQYEMILNSNSVSRNITAFALYRMAIIAHKNKKKKKALEFAKRSYELVPDENIKRFIESIPDDSEDKILKMEESDK